jgi:hypothetical protein
MLCWVLEKTGAGKVCRDKSQLPDNSKVGSECENRLRQEWLDGKY